MTAQDYLGVLRRGWRTLLGATLVGLALAGCVALVTPAKYSSQVTFYISTQGDPTSSATDAYQGSLLSQDRVKSYTQLLSSYRLGDDVVRDLGLPADPADVADELSSSVSPDTVLLTATVTDRSPARAQDIAGAVGRVFPTLVAALEKPLNSATPPTVSAQVVQGPLPSDGAVSPKVGLDLVLGGLAGLLVGISVVVLRRSLDRRIRSVEGLRHAFPEPLLGGLAHDRTVVDTPLFLRDRPRAAISEQLRTVRTNFELFNFDGASRCHVVTSAVENEGKSTVLANLALAEADAGRRVLIIEADLRKPRVASYLGLPGDVGLTQVLGGRTSLRHAAQQGPSSRLWCLAAGPLPPNPYEMIHSTQMAALLGEARAHYDTVLVDAPPLLPVADGLELARQADGVLCVVRAKHAPAASVARAHALLTGAGLTHLGVVFNAVSAAEDEGYSGYEGYGAGERSHRLDTAARTAPSAPEALPAGNATAAATPPATPARTTTGPTTGPLVTVPEQAGPTSSSAVIRPRARHRVGSERTEDAVTIVNGFGRR
jgi:capsular exopolysaccharide synthesis family protein